MSKEMDNKEKIRRPPLWFYSVCGGCCFSVSAVSRFKGNNKSGLDLKNKNLRFTKPDEPFTKQTLETPLIFPII